MRALISVTFAMCVWAATALSQEDGLSPILHAELTEDSVAVGLPLVLRVTILVPTWMPTPPKFPSFEAPNMIVRLPERASGPISEKVNGETWSGVSRSYRLYPMIPGTFALPSGAVQITYANPEDRSPTEVTLALPQVSFIATVPKGAEALDPLIVADELSLEQKFEGPEDVLTEGQAVVRKVKARIAGSSAVFLPEMIAVLEADLIQAYAGEPSLTENENRGVLSGTRTETTTYVARYGGVLDLPEINVSWFNVTSGKVETATLVGRNYRVEAPERPREPLLTKRQMLVLAGGVLLVLALIWVLHRWLLPPLNVVFASWKKRRLAGEAYAAMQVAKAISARDLRDIASARAMWDQRLPVAGTAADIAFDASLLAIGAARYGGADTTDWTAVRRSFGTARKKRLAALKRQSVATNLPPLNLR